MVGAPKLIDTNRKLVYNRLIAVRNNGKKDLNFLSKLQKVVDTKDK